MIDTSDQQLIADLLTLLDPAPLGDDRFEGPRKKGGVGRVFGGQVIAQALMAAQQNKPHVVKSCVTQEEIDKYQVSDADTDTSCKTTVTKSSPTLVEMTQTCSGPAAGTREARMEAPTPTSMKMVSKSTSGRGAGTTVNMDGKWLGADCGDTK